MAPPRSRSPFLRRDGMRRAHHAWRCSGPGAFSSFFDHPMETEEGDACFSRASVVDRLVEAGDMVHIYADLT